MNFLFLETFILKKITQKKELLEVLSALNLERLFVCSAIATHNTIVFLMRMRNHVDNVIKVEDTANLSLKSWIFLLLLKVIVRVPLILWTLNVLFWFGNPHISDEYGHKKLKSGTYTYTSFSFLNYFMENVVNRF